MLYRLMSLAVHDRAGLRSPVLHDLLDGVPHCEDHGRGGVAEHPVPDGRLPDARRRRHRPQAREGRQGHAQVPAPHHEQLRHGENE